MSPLLLDVRVMRVIAAWPGHWYAVPTVGLCGSTGVCGYVVPVKER